MLILLGAMTAAVGSVIFRKYLKRVHPEIVLFTRGLIAIGFFFVLSAVLQASIIEQVKVFPITLITALIGYGFISRFMYLISYYESMEKLPAQTVSLFLPLVTVGSLIFSHFYLGEHIHWYHWAGGVFILLGSLALMFSHEHYRGIHLERHMRHHHRRHV